MARSSRKSVSVALVVSLYQGNGKLVKNFSLSDYEYYKIQSDAEEYNRREAIRRCRPVWQGGSAPSCSWNTKPCSPSSRRRGCVVIPHALIESGYMYACRPSITPRRHPRAGLRHSPLYGRDEGSWLKYRNWILKDLSQGLDALAFITRS